MIKKEIIEIKKQTLANIIRELSIPTFIIDQNHRVIEWNKALEYLTKIKKEDILGTPDSWRGFYKKKRPMLADLLLDGKTEDLSTYYQNYTEAEYNPRGYKAEKWVNIRGKRKYIIFSATTIINNSGEKIQAVESIEDITERKKIKERHDFLNSLYRHDASNMINVCQGYLRLLEETPLSERQLNYVKESLKAAQGIISIIEKVNKLQKIEHERVKEIYIHELITDVVDKYKQEAHNNGIIIELDLPKLKSKVEGGSLLEEIFINLIQNSIQHSQCDKIRISAEKSNNEIIISIEDNGKGISDLDKRQIFKKGFKRGRNAGAGLGLFLVKSIADNYEGRVEVKDSKLGGAKFNVILKALKEEDQKQNELILIVDDNLSFLSYIRVLLESHKFNIKTALSAVEALEYLETRDFSSIPDLIISDIKMPEMSGYEFFKTISQNPKLNRIPFIFLSGLTSDKDIRLGKILGADDYITKPVQQEEILASIKGKLRRRRRELQFMTEIDEIIQKKEKPPQGSLRNSIDVSIFLVFWDDVKGPSLIKQYPEKLANSLSIRKLSTQIFQAIVPIYGQEKNIHNAEDLLFKLENIDKHAYVYFDAFKDDSKRSKQTEFMLSIIAPNISYFDSLRLKKVLAEMSSSVKKNNDIHFSAYYEDIINILETNSKL